MDEGIVPGGGATLVYMLRTREKVLEAFQDEEDDERLAGKKKPYFLLLPP